MQIKSRKEELRFHQQEINYKLSSDQGGGKLSIPSSQANVTQQYGVTGYSVGVISETSSPSGLQTVFQEYWKLLRGFPISNLTKLVRIHIIFHFSRRIVA